MVRWIRPDVIDTGKSNRQSPQLAHGQLRELIPRRQCQWCFLRDIDVLTEHERQLLWVQELTTNQLLKWQEVCKSIARWAGSGQVAIKRHFVLVPTPSPDLSAKLAYTRTTRVKEQQVQFTPSLGRVQKTVSRTREVFPTGSTTLLRLQLWRTRDCAHRSRHVGFFFLFSFFFWRERCLPKVSWKSNPAAPGLANQVWPFKKRALCSRENAHGWLRVTGTCF